MSNRDARHALHSGKVYFHDAPTADPTREVDPDMVTIRANAPRVRVGLDPVVCFRDRDLAVLFKPSGLLSVPAQGRRGERTVIGELSRALGEVLPVHRLDEPTSGLMMVARNEASQAALKQLFFTHDIERRYLALVWGRFPSQPVTVDNQLVRDRGDGRRGSSQSHDGKRAITELHRVAELGHQCSLVEARLATGRTHQVRIHLAELGFPVLGDRLYDDRRRQPTRLALHAHRLGFRHPISGEQVSFLAPLADDLERVRRDLANPRSHRRRR